MCVRNTHLVDPERIKQLCFSNWGVLPSESHTKMFTERSFYLTHRAEVGGDNLACKQLKISNQWDQT